MFYAVYQINETVEKRVFFIPLFESTYVLPVELFESFVDESQMKIDIELYVNALVATETFWSLHQKPSGLLLLREEVQYQMFDQDACYLGGRRTLVVLAPPKYIDKMYRDMTNQELDNEVLDAICDKDAYIKFLDSFKLPYKVCELDDIDRVTHYPLSIDIENPLIQN